MLNYRAALDRTFQALADPTRRDILARLAQGPISVSELARPVAMSLPAVIQHLSVLEAAGLVLTERVGRARVCRIEAQTLSYAEQWINQCRIESLRPGHSTDP
jgi:DNA-binding transcriptional ArsR family regulator